MLDEVALYQHLDMALDRLRGDARFCLEPWHFQAGIGLDAVEHCLLAPVQGLSGGTARSESCGGTAESRPQ